MWKDLYLCAIDYTKVFYRVQHKELHEVLETISPQASYKVTKIQRFTESYKI